MVYITRREHFNSAHKLNVPEWSEEKNLEVFGKCANPNWHGHNYELEVTVKGEPNPVTGFVINLKDLSTILRTKITDKLDHRNMNLDVDFMHGVQPSTENVALKIWEQIYSDITALGAELHCVKVKETENNSVEYYG
jgi:6-pyruvoyltetrahydropterin/6-carboxytetrahydropterin synthase